MLEVLEVRKDVQGINAVPLFLPSAGGSLGAPIPCISLQCSFAIPAYLQGLDSWSKGVF